MTNGTPKQGPGPAPTSPPPPMTPDSDTLRAVVDGHLPHGDRTR